MFFAPCRTFVDLLEFRFGYCWDAFELARAKKQPEIFDRCIQKTFSDEHVQRRINETVISCWSYNNEKPYMWEVYAQSQAAIIVTVREAELRAYITKHWGDNATACGVRYGFETHQIFPEFMARPRDRQWDKDYDLFFHKHPFYKFEQEFRAVIFGQTKAVSLQLPNEMVNEITLSPLAPLEPSLLAGLKDQFGDRVQGSRLSWRLAQPKKTFSIEDYMRDEKTTKSPEMVKWFEELTRLKAQDQTKGWNDPQAPPLPEGWTEVTRRIKEMEKQLNQAIFKARRSEEPPNGLIKNAYPRSTSLARGPIDARSKIQRR